MHPHRTLGRSDLAVAPWCLGGNVFGWTADEATSFRLLDAFVDAGFNFIDTADVYSKWVPGHVGGESETVIGRWLAKRRNRDKVVIATKVGMMRDPGKHNLDRDHILHSVDASLKRLQTDYIDLYQSHQDDPSRPVDEPLHTYAELIRSGKVRCIGASNFSPERFRSALDASQTSGLPRYETMQPEYNLYARDGFEGEMLDLCVEQQIGVIPYFSLAAGFLTGKYRSEKDFGKSQRGGGMAKYLNPRGLRILDALDSIAHATSVQPAEVALAWLAARPSIAAPIASATSVEQIASLAKAFSGPLAPSDIQALNAASAA